ncbi:MAG: hypothetical protein KC912_01620 [Proteobacteria bacterium]|nr:hypothetical protein [Pseudomonadota bacterium]
MSRVIRNVRVLDPRTERDERLDVEVSGHGEVDGSELVLCPAFVDLVADRRGDADDAAAETGGFAACVGEPVGRPWQVRDQIVPATPMRLASAQLTVDGLGEELADMATLVDAGARALSDGGRPLRSTRTLLAALEYARDLGVPVFLRPSDPDLEGAGLIRAGAPAATLGLPGVLPEAEVLGIYRAAALAKASGCAVHLTHIWSAAGVEALRRAKVDLPALTASTTPLHLTQRPERLAELHYAGFARIHPPVGDAQDREALAEAVRDGTIDAVASHHRSVLRHEQDCELELAIPGTRTQEATFGLVHRALGDVEATVRALVQGPRHVLGAVDVSKWALLEPDAEWSVAEGPSALSGELVRGRVLELLETV